jgi:hypothetical protein
MRCASIVLAFVLFGPSIGAAQDRALAAPAAPTAPSEVGEGK